MYFECHNETKNILHGRFEISLPTKGICFFRTRIISENRQNLGLLIVVPENLMISGFGKGCVLSLMSTNKYRCESLNIHNTYKLECS